MSAEQRLADLEQQLGNFTNQARQELQTANKRNLALEQEVGQLKQQQAEAGIYLQNIRIATGIPDTRPTPGTHAHFARGKDIS
eukprot:7749865-Alexandrium_andersonii.AAC.1